MLFLPALPAPERGGAGYDSLSGYESYAGYESCDMEGGEGEEETEERERERGMYILYSGTSQ